MIRQILSWKTIEGNRRLRVRIRIRFLLFYSELVPTYPWCNMFGDFTWTDKIWGGNDRWTPSIPRFLYVLTTKQVPNQMFFRVGQNFQIWRAQIVLLIMLSFLNDKTKCFTGNTWKLRFPDCLKLFLRRKTSTKGGNILSFLSSSVVLRTLSNIWYGEICKNS